MREAGGERRGLAEVAPEADDAPARVGGLQLRQNSKLSSVLPSSTTMIS